MQSLASGLLAQFKQGRMFIERATPGGGRSFDPGAPVKSYVEVDAVGKGVNEYFKAAGLADASEIRVTTAVVAGFTPSIETDWLIIGGEPTGDPITAVTGGIRMKIKEYNAVPPAGTAVVWKFKVAKG
jgi:hypothetical protein